MENKCNGRCESCSVSQRTYCSAQISYYLLEELSIIKSMLQVPENDKPIILRSEPNVPGAENKEQ